MSTIEEVVVDAKIKNRAWRVSFETPYGKDYRVDLHNEQLILDDEYNELSRKELDSVSKVLIHHGEPTEVLGETVTLQDGTIISMSQVLEAGSLFGDKWRADAGIGVSV